LDIKFDKIKMIDDSDDLSEGEFRFGFFVNDDIAPNNVTLQYPPVSGEVGIASGETEEPLNRNAHVWPYDANSVSLKVNAVENDDDPGPADEDYENFGSFYLDPDLGTGSSEQWEWLQGQKRLTFIGLTQEPSQRRGF